MPGRTACPDLWLILALGLAACLAAIAFNQPGLATEDSSKVELPSLLPRSPHAWPGNHIP